MDSGKATFRIFARVRAGVGARRVSGFSMAWKFLFRGMENRGISQPGFSMVWKFFFHEREERIYGFRKGHFPDFRACTRGRGRA
jgi:hypothetical protein